MCNRTAARTKRVVPQDPPPHRYNRWQTKFYSTTWMCLPFGVRRIKTRMS